MLKALFFLALTLLVLAFFFPHLSYLAIAFLALTPIFRLLRDALYFFAQKKRLYGMLSVALLAFLVISYALRIT